MFLSGANCTVDVWDRFKRHFDDPEILYAAYPHAITKQAETVSDITGWVFETYQHVQPLNFIVGHSMGGMIALELASRYAFHCEKIILIESNLKPANAFYRNLMTDQHMQAFGKQILSMLQSEAPFYNDALKHSLQEDFDYTDLVRNCPGEVYGIFGDRGVEDYAARVSDLCLDKDVADRIHFYFVKDSCHMPMVENPEALAAIIQHIHAL